MDLNSGGDPTFALEIDSIFQRLSHPLRHSSKRSSTPYQAGFWKIYVNGRDLVRWTVSRLFANKAVNIILELFASQKNLKFWTLKGSSSWKHIFSETTSWPDPTGSTGPTFQSLEVFDALQQLHGGKIGRSTSQAITAFTSLLAFRPGSAATWGCAPWTCSCCIGSLLWSWGWKQTRILMLIHIHGQPPVLIDGNFQVWPAAWFVDDLCCILRLQSVAVFMSTFQWASQFTVLGRSWKCMKYPLKRRNGKGGVKLRKKTCNLLWHVDAIGSPFKFGIGLLFPAPCAESAALTRNKPISWEASRNGRVGRGACQSREKFYDGFVVSTALEENLGRWLGSTFRTQWCEE